MKIEFIQSKGQWYARLKAENGKIIAHTEKYKQLRSAKAAVQLIQDGAWRADVKVIDAAK